MPTYLQAVLRAVDDGQQPAVHVRERQQHGALGFTGGHRRLLVDLGVIFVDNDTAPPEQLAGALLALLHQLDYVVIPR